MYNACDIIEGEVAGRAHSGGGFAGDLEAAKGKPSRDNGQKSGGWGWPWNW